MMFLKFRLCTNAETLGIEQDEVAELYEVYAQAEDALKALAVDDAIEIEIKHESLFCAWNGGYCTKRDAGFGPLVLVCGYTEKEEIDNDEHERRYFSKHEPERTLPQFVLDAIERAYDLIAPVLTELENRERVQ